MPLPLNTRVGKYTINRCIKENTYTSTYLVDDENGQRLFMKVFQTDKVPEKLKINGIVAEIINARRIAQDEDIIFCKDSGEVTVDGTNYQCMVAPFIQGKLLSEALQGGAVFEEVDAISIALKLMSAMALINQDPGFCHNDICPQNVLCRDEEGSVGSPVLIDLGHLWEPVNGAPPFPVEDLQPCYMAPEALKGIFQQEGDVYSIAVIFYQMLTGKLPWEVDLSGLTTFAQRKQAIREARAKGWSMPEGLNPRSELILREGLKENRNERPNADSIFKLLEKEFPSRGEKEAADTGKSTKSTTEDENVNESRAAVTLRRGEKGRGGFADVAGMEALKEKLSKRIIWVLQDHERAKRYRLMPPNGMLLYGPPGCGKTFFAQKFAEESGFNYVLVNGSDLGSTYIHGTQGKIADLFKTAEKNAPTVICFDEFDSFVPSRGSDSAVHRADEVNEFLSQLNNCSARGIFVIGTTNRIDMIDPAVLRKGRLDMHVEIPAPDTQTRKLMFALHLKGRPQDESLNLDRLAALTENYASSDIAYLVNEAALVAALADEPIGMRHLEEAIQANPSSLGAKETRRRIGF